MNVRRAPVVLILLAVAVAVALACADDASRSEPSPTGSAAAFAAASGEFDRGHSFAYVNDAGALWLVDAETLEQRQVATDISFEETRAVWSPNGRYVGYRDQFGRLLVIDFAAESNRVIEEDVRADFAWAGDSSLLGYGKGAGLDGNWVAEPDGMRKESLSTTRVVEFSPDGRRALVAMPASASDVAPRGSEYAILNFDDWSARPLGVPVDGYWPPAWSPDSRYLAFWTENGGGTAIIGPMAIFDTRTWRSYDIGPFTDDETPQWAPSTERAIFHNVKIDGDAGTVTELFPRPGASDAANEPFPQPGAVIGWSPDERYVAIVEGNGFGAGPRSLVLLEPVTGARVVLDENDASLSHPSAPGYIGSWSGDGRYLAFGVIAESGGASWFVLDVASGQVQAVDVAGGYAASYSPDSAYLMLLASAGAPRPAIVVANADGTSVRDAGEGYVAAGSASFNSSSAWWRPEAR